MMDPGDLDNRAVRGPAPLASLPGRQRATLDIVVQYVRATGEPCPANYIARRLNIHHSTIQEHLQRLHRKGWLRAPNSPAVPTRVR